MTKNKDDDFEFLKTWLTEELTKRGYFLHAQIQVFSKLAAVEKRLERLRKIESFLEEV